MTSVGDMSFGQGVGDFYVNRPEAAAQVVGTRLNLFQGDWFLDLTQGTPWRTKVLGRFTADTRDAILLARIASSPGVSEVTSYASQLARQPREFSVQATVRTVYGDANVRPLTDSPNVFSPEFSTAFLQRSQANFQVQFAQR